MLNELSLKLKEVFWNEPWILVSIDVCFGYCINGNNIPFHERLRKNIENEVTDNDLSDCGCGNVFIPLPGGSPCTA